MSISIFDLFKIGIGPSSSHTVGPMKAALAFVESLAAEGVLASVAGMEIDLFGSLGATGLGHATDRAVILGLRGERPETVDPDAVPGILDTVAATKKLSLAGGCEIDFDPAADIRFDGDTVLPFHPNGMRFTARDASAREIASGTYYSLGGGFIVSESEAGAAPGEAADAAKVPYPFHSGADLLRLCEENRLPISQLVLENEKVFRGEDETRRKLLELWAVMRDGVRRGIRTEGILPGSLKLPRRAPKLWRRLNKKPKIDGKDPLCDLDWVDLYALAVNEENAAGGRVVTAPTNGAAGVIPAVLHYCVELLGESEEEPIIRFFLTAAAIGFLYKENASFSAADVGCQGEVGVACSMAAGALAEYRGGTPLQVENAAEIAMEHNLGLTCDPVGGLVQIPCIERNAMGAVKAINAARMALREEGDHYVSLDQVIKTMWETGGDMNSKYKETARGGLAVNVPEC